MTPADLKALREVPGCQGRVPPAYGILHLAACQWSQCDACLSLLAEAVIRQAVERMDENEIGAKTDVWRAHLLSMLLPTPPTTEEG